MTATSTELYQAAYQAQSKGMFATAFELWTKCANHADTSLERYNMALQERLHCKEKMVASGFWAA